MPFPHKRARSNTFIYRQSCCANISSKLATSYIAKVGDFIYRQSCCANGATGLSNGMNAQNQPNPSRTDQGPRLGFRQKGPVRKMHNQSHCAHCVSRVSEGSAQNASSLRTLESHTQTAIVQHASDWKRTNKFPSRKRAPTDWGSQTVFPGCCWHLFD